MKSTILALAALFGVSAAQAESLTWTLQNDSGEFALLRFYSKSRNAVWPASNRAYNLPADGQTYTFSLNCFAGEYICYGAWIGRTPHIGWGAGLTGRNACDQCCNHCNGAVLTVPALVLGHFE
jgi:hypothetical protein